MLVDRLWPRGVARAAAGFTEWSKEVAPGPELAGGTDTIRSASRSSHAAIARSSRAAALGALFRLRDKARTEDLVLVTAARSLELSGAAVLGEVLAGS